MVRWIIGSILHGGPIELFLVPVSAPTKAVGCVMMHIKEPLLLSRKSSPYGGSWFPLLLFEWFFTICLTPYNCNQNVLRASLNKPFPSFLMVPLHFFLWCTSSFSSFVT